MTILLAEIGGAVADRTVLLDQGRHQIVGRFEAVGVARCIPSGETLNVVAGFRLRLGRNGQQILVAVRGDEIELEIDFLLLGPFLAELAQRLVGPGDPVVPEPDGQFPGGIGAAHKRRRQNRCRQRSVAQHGAPCRRRHSRLHRPVSPAPDRRTPVRSPSIQRIAGRIRL
jgi:hypothetical protein